MKTLNFGLSKILNDLGLLDNIETEWKIQLLPTKIGNKWNKGRLVKNWNGKGRIYKTLTLEEAIDIILKNKKAFEIVFSFSNDIVLVDYNNKHKYDIIEQFCHGDKTKNIEKCLEYLLDNNLLLIGQEKKR